MFGFVKHAMQRFCQYASNAGFWQPSPRLQYCLLQRVQRLLKRRRDRVALLVIVDERLEAGLQVAAHERLRAVRDKT